MAKKTLGKIYRLRRAIKNKKSLEVTFPYEVVEKKAISKGLSVEEFLKHYHAIATSTRKGVYYTFEEANHEEENPIPQRAGHQSDSYTDAPA